MNNCDENTKHKRKKLKHRLISIAVSAAIVTNTLPISGISEYFNFAELLKASAADGFEPLDVSRFAGNELQLSSDEFVSYCYHYQNTPSFDAEHKNDTIRLAGTISLSDNFVGLGTEANPFEGKLRFIGDRYTVEADRAVFCYLSDKAKIWKNSEDSNIVLAIIRSSSVGSGESKPLLADHIVSGSGTGNWTVELSDASNYSGVFGELGQGAHVELTFTNESGGTIVSNGTDELADAGLFCGSMGENSYLKVDYTGSYTNVTSANGNAGGLVGTMGSGSTLELTAAPSSYAPTVTSNGGYAGGIVGDMAPTAQITDTSSDPLNITVGAAEVKGSTGAGGLYGRYGYTGNKKIDLTSSSFSTSAQVSGGYCGKLFGVLETSGDLTVTSNNSEISCSTLSSGGGHFGGVIGKLVTSSLTNTVYVEKLKINATENTALSTFGGVFGYVDSASYVKVDNVEVNAVNPENASLFGGVIGETSADDGVFADIGSFKLTASGYKGGGIVGKFNNGVLRLSGTTNMSAATPASANGCGQLIGENDNVLVYALGNGSSASPTAFSSGWSYLRCSGAQADDLGTWGEVVRLDSIETDLLTFTSSAHTVTLKAPVAAMATQLDLVKTALNMQLYNSSGYGCLLFTSAPSNALSLSSDISLANTGVIGFMRDGGSNTGTFSGTFNGYSHKITLAVGEPYGVYTTGQTEGIGQIYRHNAIGLFSVLGGANCSVSNLTVDGTITVRNCVDGMNIGCIAAKNDGDVSLSGVTIGEISGSTRSMTVNYHEGTVIESSEATGKNIGGLIGFVGTDGTITVSGTSAVNAEIDLTGNHTSYNTYGGAIGKITADAFTVDIGPANDAANKLTIGMQADVRGVTAVGSDSNGGGLIGRIEKSGGSYATRIVNVNNLDFTGCTVGNASSANGGGFLGYSWLNATANINGMTLTSNNIIDNYTANGAAGGNTNVGGMCYVATGKWKVDSLSVSSLSMTSGGGTSFGMLVNKAYDGRDGLYLDVLKSGYTLTPSGITLTSVSSTSKYDELAAYSAKDANSVLTGGAGVISINMNSARYSSAAPAENKDATVTANGTYSNQLSGHSVNPTSRYYYNLDVLGSSDNGQNLLLWSVKKYAASNIYGEFVSTLTDSQLRGTANMTGLSFYPVAKADGITIGDLTLKLDYSGIYAKTGAAMDPAAADQHYLMQSGLFLNSSAGSALTISGDLVFSGNFLEVGDYNGVLISNRMQGSLDSKDGSITLANVIPMRSGSNAADGYLLINEIYRKDVNALIPELKLYNVSTSGYAQDTAVAKSLIGPASGPALKIEFSKIKLDADSNAIFSKATLLDSIKTNKDAQLRYNFTLDDDWGDADEDGNWDHNVTYGKEITGSVEHPNMERRYSRGADDEDEPFFVRSDAVPVASNSGPSDFSLYLPYVREPYTAASESGLYYRELNVNIENSGLTNGCGTYNDPYLLSTPEQLNAVAAFLLTENDGGTLGKVKLPKTKPTNLSSGERWCSSNDAEYSFKTELEKFTSSVTGAEQWEVADVQEYLAAAYYKVTADITLDSEFEGLGGSTANTAFRGVIVGETNDDGTPKHSITNSGTNPFIKVSNGTVIKDLKIQVRSNISCNQESVKTSDKYNTFGYNNTQDNANRFSFYGGIIGEIMGGDNIIDNSYVDFGSSVVTLSGTHGTAIPVGGYVGVVVYGGLIFKNMDARNTTIGSTGLNVQYTGENYNLADNSDEEAWAAIYVNPIVGRVINGYAVNETGGNALDAEGAPVEQFSVTEDGHYHDDDKTARTGTQHTLKNGTKHYTIADINKSETNKLWFGTRTQRLGENGLPLTDENQNPVYDYSNQVPNGSNNGVINLPNAQSMFILSLITQSCAGTATTADGVYNGSLSYGTNSGNVYGMSHNADYTSVGAGTSASANAISDFNSFASKDTAANTATPYIIRYYTEIKEEAVSEDKGWTISFVDNNGNTKYLRLAGDTLYIDSNPYFFNTITKVNGKWKIQGDNNGSPCYIQCKWTNGFGGATSWDDGTKIDLYNSDSNIYNDENIDGNSFYLSNQRNLSGDQGKRYYFEGTKLSGRWVRATTDLSQARLVTFNHVIETSASTSTPMYARCVTSTNGYYDINLTGSGTYMLPDSYRGLGCVGIYDSVTTVVNNKYSMKVDKFDGNGCTIDADIYLNKFQTDNYFNVLHAGTNQSLSSDITTFKGNGSGGSGLSENHGIGLFDSIIMKNASSEIGNFTLTGSVNTEIYGDDYSASNQEWIGVDGGYGDKDETNIRRSLWLSVGGVCGWSTNGVEIKFSNIALNDLTVNGADFVGGLLGFSGLNSASQKIVAQQCSANDISLKMTSAHQVGTAAQTRNAMGAFVGKVQEGAVVIYGTEHNYTTTGGVRDVNDDLDDYSVVNIKSFGFGEPSLNYYVSTGGLVGFAGHCCQAYDMKVTSSDTTVTIGKSDVGYSGGIVGVMQPFKGGQSSGYAEFINCTIDNLNIAAINAGGFYGGKWDGEYVPYRIDLNNCKVIGNGSNTITGVDYAGGLVGHGFVYTRIDDAANIIISDCRVTDYTISASSGKYSGGFVGYCNSKLQSITCYIHDSSVENCIIGQGTDYAGGAIGGVAKKNDNKILGYNIKLDNVTSPSTSKGAWIGCVATSDKATQIQFTGMAIYGSGFAKNIGNWTSTDDKNNTNATFIYADYSGMSYGTEGDVEAVSGSAGFVIDENTRTVIRTLTDQQGKMQLLTYSYSEDIVGTPDGIPSDWTLISNEIYSLDEDTKTITRKVIPVGGGTIRELTYNYTAAPNKTATDEGDHWSIDEINGTITRISGGFEYVYTIAVSGLNKGVTVDMPKYPFVNVNPQSKLGDVEVLSGDAAVLYGGTKNSHRTLYSYDGDNGEKQYYPSADTMAAKIYYDLDRQTENSTRRYTTFNNDLIRTATSEGSTLLAYMQKTADDDGDRISTFIKERQISDVPDNVDDFAVVVIANSDDTETTNLINRYIQLVTNTPSSKNYAKSDTYYNVDIKTCTYVYENGNGSFTIDPDQDQDTTALYIANDQFKLRRQREDSSQRADTFTLVDVQFKDPLQTDKIAYHLYVPVYTVKEMNVKLSVVAKTGAYSASDTNNAYAGLIAEYQSSGSQFNHVDSLDTWMTHYIRYEYDPEDITALIRQGKIRWNYDKYLKFDTISNANTENPLPGVKQGDDTYMVLVDPNGEIAKAYYANISDMDTYPSSNGNLSSTGYDVDFHKFTSDGNDGFEYRSFNDIIENDLVAEPNQGHGQYILLDNTTETDRAKIEAGGYHVCIGDAYYEFTNKNNGDWDIELKEGTTAIYEDYYLSIKVPRPDGYENELYHYEIKAPSERLSADNTIKETAFTEKVKSAGLTHMFKCTMLIADLFEQTVTTEIVESGQTEKISRLNVLTHNEQITPNDNELKLDISTQISPINPDALTFMNADEFFQSFYITLVRYSGGITENDIQALAAVNAKYRIGTAITDDNDGTDCVVSVDPNGYYINVQTFTHESAETVGQEQGIINYLSTSSGTDEKRKVEVFARISMVFDEDLLENEFPKSTDADNEGVNIQAASNLAYDTSALPYSSMTKKYDDPGLDGHYYYINDVKTASLRYAAMANDIDKYDEIGYNSSNRSTLGVNGNSVDDTNRTNKLDGGYMPVNTQAFYFVGDVPNAEEAEYVKLTFKLYKKVNGSYSGSYITSLANYLDGNVEFTLGTDTVSGTVDNGIVTAVLALEDYDFAASGTIATDITFNAKSGEDFHEYANYRIYLTAELYKDAACTENVDSSTASDELIYTNARINPEFITRPSNG